jgi:glycosyltransferase involved in cell wall biosynthesis
MEQRCSTVSVVSATFNEEEGVRPTLEELQNVLGNSHLIVVYGNSVDRTIKILETGAQMFCCKMANGRL